jgi:thiamine-phosphate pyrophosphorylase
MRLYALCDQETLDAKGVSLESFVAICKAKNAEIIQYRNKSGDIDLIATRLKKLRSLWDRTLIINDALQLHLFCDGVHLGQEDLQTIDPDPATAVKKLRKIVGPDKWLGLSTHNEEEVRAANRLDLDYIGLGAYRSTGTKAEAKVLGDKLDAVAALSTHPVAAIGGVRFDDTFEHVTYHVIGSGLYKENA